MATGGSGDVLTGMIGAFLARRLRSAARRSRPAASFTVLAGDLAVADRGEEGLVAGDIIEAIPGALNPAAAMRHVSRSADETRALGERLGARLGKGDVVACIGALGAGKTCFLQGLARGLGVTTDVTSPTFVLVNQYRGRLPVYHVDAYRTGSLTELVDLGLEEMLHGDGVTIVEWADKLLPLLPRAHRHRHHQRDSETSLGRSSCRASGDPGGRL